MKKPLVINKGDVSSKTQSIKATQSVRATQSLKATHAIKSVPPRPAAVAGKPGTRQQSPASSRKPEGGGVWIAWVVAGGSLLLILVIACFYMIRSRDDAAHRAAVNRARSAQTQRHSSQPRKEEGLWMGDYMKKNGTVSNDMLRGRLERMGRAPQE